MILLSILIPSVPSRYLKALNLFSHLEYQISLLTPFNKMAPVEILLLTDNKKRSIGAKRDSLVQMAKGKYLAFVDDDDRVSEDYVYELIKAIKEGKGEDVISFRQEAIIDGVKGVIDFDIKNENKEFNCLGITKRKPFHVCAWKTSIAKEHRFADVNYSEDWHWCKRVLHNVYTQKKIKKILHYYVYDSKTTEASTEKNEVFKTGTEHKNIFNR
jgi:glycosyltransferase involved in cell wall biosynthesis